MHLEAPKLYVFNKKWQVTFFAFFDHRLKIFFSLYCRMMPFPTALSAEDPRFRMFGCLGYIKNKHIAGWLNTYENHQLLLIRDT